MAGFLPCVQMGVAPTWVTEQSSFRGRIRLGLQMRGLKPCHRARSGFAAGTDIHKPASGAMNGRESSCLASEPAGLPTDCEW